MRKRELGGTGIMVSELCLGTMTWGSQNTEAEGHAQLDLGTGRGIDFIDTAEMYPTNPVLAETVGRTEEIIGSWLARRGRRDDLVIATKISGNGRKEIRGGEDITPASIRRALEASLRRLGTEYVDLYQFHWPNRGSYSFRQNWKYDPSRQPPKAEVEANMLACLETLQALVQEGKIRHFGLSNETAWGMAEWLRLAGGGAPRAVSIQNEYSLMCRLYDTDLAELGRHEKVTLLAYSPLATGLLSGKYTGGALPPGSRATRTPDLGGRMGPRALAVADRYVALAQAAGLDPVTMAIAWTLTRPFPIVPIIGATSCEQLERSLDAAGTVLPKEILTAIDRVHHEDPMPF